MNTPESNEICVLRLGHRRERDKRITSHLGLTARAFGADKIILSGEEDNSPIETWNSVTSRFGGGFNCYYEPKPLKLLRKISKNKSSTIIHLTMYGEDMEETIPKIPNDNSMIIVVGGTKVPGEVYGLSDYNICIGNQPHSEVAALALFLDALTDGEGFDQEFPNAKLIIHPSKSGKDVKEV